MAWTAPRTWVTGEVVTASHMNAHVRDNLLALATAFLIPVHQTGKQYHSQGGTLSQATLTVTAGRLYGVPFHVPATTTYDRLILNGSSTGNVRMGIYSDNGGVPGALVLDGGAVAMSSPQITISQSLSGPAKYWLACLFDNTPNSVDELNFNSFLGDWATGVYRTQSYGALPDPFGGSLTYTGQSPDVRVRAA